MKKETESKTPKDRYFETYNGWLRATRKLDGFVKIHGDKDICHAEFEVNDGPIRIYAEWDGAYGIIEYFEKI